MGGFKLLALAAMICVSTNESYKIEKSFNVGKGVEYVVSHDDTGTLGIPWFWLSRADVKTDKKKAAAYCKTMGIEWELGYMNGSHFSEAISATIQNAEKLLADPEKLAQSDYFWVGAEFDKYDTYMFVWTKTNYTVHQSGVQYFTGAIDDEDKFRYEYDFFANQTYGLVTYIPEGSAYLRYKASKANEKHRYMCTKTKAIPVKPTSAPKPTTSKAPKEPGWGAPIARH